MKRITPLMILPLILLWGCDDLFDEGDTQKSFDGDPQVELKPITQEVSEVAGFTTVSVQLIGEQRDSDLEVEFSVNDDQTTAEDGVHYQIMSESPVTLESDSSSVDIEIQIIDSGAFENGEVALSIDLESASDGVEVAQNLSNADIFISEFERNAELNTQALDATEDDNELLVTGVTGFAGDYLVVTTNPEDGDFTGETIAGFTQLQGVLDGSTVAVDVDGADPVDHVAHVIRAAHISDNSIDESVVSSETADNVAASSEVAPVYVVNQFSWSDATYDDDGGLLSTGTVTVDVIEISYNGQAGEDLISIDLHEDGEEGIGAFVGISQEDLEVNQVHNDVDIDVVEPVDPGEEEPEREDSTIEETGDFFAMAHLGEAGEDVNGDRIPAQNPALLTGLLEENEEGELVPAFMPVGDSAKITIED